MGPWLVFHEYGHNTTVRRQFHAVPIPGRNEEELVIVAKEKEESGVL